MIGRAWATAGLAAVAMAALVAAPAGASVEDVVAAGPNGSASFAFTKDAGGFDHVKERSWSASTIPGLQPGDLVGRLRRRCTAGRRGRRR